MEFWGRRKNCAHLSKKNSERNGLNGEGAERIFSGNNHSTKSLVFLKSHLVDSPRAARIPADQNTSPHSAGRKRRPPILKKTHLEFVLSHYRILNIQGFCTSNRSSPAAGPALSRIPPCACGGRRRCRLREAKKKQEQTLFKDLRVGLDYQKKQGK